MGSVKPVFAVPLHSISCGESPPPSIIAGAIESQDSRDLSFHLNPESGTVGMAGYEAWAGTHAEFLMSVPASRRRPVADALEIF